MPPWTACHFARAGQGRRLVQFCATMDYDAVMVLRTEQNAPRKQVLLVTVMALILAASLSAAYAITRWQMPSASLRAILHNPRQLSAIYLMQKLGLTAVSTADVRILPQAPVLAMARTSGTAARLFCVFEMAPSSTQTHSPVDQGVQAFEQQILKSNPGMSLVHEEDAMPLQTNTIYTFENLNATTAPVLYVAATERNGRLRAITYSGASPWTLPDSIVFISARSSFLEAGSNNTPTTKPAFKLPTGINT